MELIVNSRWEMMASMPPEKTWALISICENADYPIVQMNDFFVYRLNLQFHDVDQFAYEADDTEIILFNEDHAVQIWDFVEEVKDKVEILFVHCLMGQCRSAAVAAAIEKTMTDDDMRFFNGGKYRPNMRVYRGVLEEAFNRNMIG